ncbi:DUF3226 domain-containing protein [uncultured Alistipes sp.]|uniref:DUF3226 domain-containing protein n=1 Tax=uncultured Alistipes sp. TaxID=538949 RepID=UPI0025F06652|nr:DUF3226 domain-containing protein [uncultured Alistipes sp.]
MMASLNKVFNQHLYVEGPTDKHVTLALCQRMSVPETFDVIDESGISTLLDNMRIRIKGTGNTKTIGIIIDADDNLTARWEQIKTILHNSHKYANIPNIIPEDGLILPPVQPDDIKIGVWMMPNNNLNGMLEDFMIELIPDEDDLLPLVDRVLENIERTEQNRYNISHHSKARIHTWLAWQEFPGTPLGLAVTKHYFETRPIICQKFTTWLNRLFNSD